MPNVGDHRLFKNKVNALSFTSPFTTYSAEALRRYSAEAGTQDEGVSALLSGCTQCPWEADRQAATEELAVRDVQGGGGAG